MGSKIARVIETLFRVYDKEGNLVDFKLNEIQRRIDNEIIAPIERMREAGFPEDHPQINQLRNSILKYRQGGVTTLVMAWYLVECMHRYAVCVMLTHDREHSERLLQRARVMLLNLKGAKPKTSRLNDNEVGFEKTNSVFYIGTAGSKEFGRSATITHLHCSEIAFWKDPAHLMKSLFQAVPKRTGIITQETTANGWGNWFQKSYYAYQIDRGGFRAHFFPWYIHDEYVSSTPFNYNDVEKTEHFVERQLYKRIRRARPDLPRTEVIRKLQWRREKIDENQGDADRDNAIRSFNQEYPSTVEEAFILTGGSLFGNVVLHPNNLWKNSGPNTFRLIGHPKPGYTYTLGCDFSGGTGNDESTIDVFCVETKEQVYEYASSRVNPVTFAEHVANVGKEFNYAYLVPEVNSHGIAGVAILKRIYDLNRIYKHIIPKGWTNAQNNIPSYGYGWKTSATSKPYLVGIAQQFVISGIRIYSSKLYDQLMSFTEDPETGKLEGTGDHDDQAIAFMLACIGILKQYRLKGAWIDINPDGEVPEIPMIEVLPAKEPNVINVSWRDDEGTLLIPFKDMFGYKRKSAQA